MLSSNGNLSSSSHCRPKYQECPRVCGSFPCYIFPNSVTLRIYNEVQPMSGRCSRISCAVTNTLYFKCRRKFGRPSETHLVDDGGMSVLNFCHKDPQTVFIFSGGDSSRKIGHLKHYVEGDETKFVCTFLDIFQHKERHLVMTSPVGSDASVDFMLGEEENAIWLTKMFMSNRSLLDTGRKYTYQIDIPAGVDVALVSALGFLRFEKIHRSIFLTSQEDRPVCCFDPGFLFQKATVFQVEQRGLLGTTILFKGITKCADEEHTFTATRWRKTCGTTDDIVLSDQNNEPILTIKQVVSCSMLLCDAHWDVFTCEDEDDDMYSKVCRINGRRNETRFEDGVGGQQRLVIFKRESDLKSVIFYLGVDKVPIAQLTEVQKEMSGRRLEIAPGVDIALIIAICSVYLSNSFNYVVHKYL